MNNHVTRWAKKPLATYTEEMRVEMERIERLLSDMEAIDFEKPITPEVRLIDAGIHAIWNIEVQEVAEVRYFTIPGDEQLNVADCDAVVVRPQQVGDGVIFYIHGGGWCLGSTKTHVGAMRALANASGKTVVGVDYRLAPENPFPAGLNDVVWAYRSILASPEKFDLSDGPIVIAGDSAGANLALAAMLYEVQAGRPLPAGALLFYGCYTPDFSAPSYQQYAEDHLLTKPIMRQLWNSYIPDTDNHNNPLAAPLAASDEQLKALPPVFLAAAEMDPIASDTYMLKDRLEKLGRSEDSIWVEEGTIHGYVQMVFQLEASRRTHTKAAAAANRFMAQASSSAVNRI